MMLPAPSTVAATLYRRALEPVRRELQPFLHEDVERGDPLSHILLSLVAGLVAFACTIIAAALVLGPVVLYAVLYTTAAAVVRALHALRDRR